MRKSPRISTNGGNAALGNPLANALAGLEIPVQSADTPAMIPPMPCDASVRKGGVRIRRSTAHRGGKTVVVIDGFAPQISDAEIKKLATEIRRATGTGGTCKDRTFEIQGEMSDKVRTLLSAQGFMVRGE